MIDPTIVSRLVGRRRREDGRSGRTGSAGPQVLENPRVLAALALLRSPVA